MDIAAIIGWFTTNFAVLIAGILTVLGGFSILAKLTPTEADDRIIQSILNIIHGLGLTKK